MGQFGEDQHEGEQQPLAWSPAYLSKEIMRLSPGLGEAQAVQRFAAECGLTARAVQNHIRRPRAYPLPDPTRLIYARTLARLKVSCLQEFTNENLELIRLQVGESPPEIARPSLLLSVASGVLLIISWGSLIAAYQLGRRELHTAWYYRYHLLASKDYSDDVGIVASLLSGHELPIGFLLEGVRGTLSLFLAFVLLPSLFPASYSEIFCFQKCSDAISANRTATVARAVLTLVAIILGGYELQQLFVSSNDLFNWGRLEGLYVHDACVDYETYLCYLPYSLVNYCAACPFFVVIPYFAARNTRVGSVAEVYKVGLNYLAFTKWMSIWLLFESWLGLYTLSGNGVIRAFFTWFLVSLLSINALRLIYSKYPNKNTIGLWLYSWDARVAIICIGLSFLHLFALPLCRI